MILIFFKFFQKIFLKLGSFMRTLELIIFQIIIGTRGNFNIIIFLLKKEILLSWYSKATK